MKKTNLFYSSRFLNAKPTKAFTCFLILAFISMQCPFVEALEDQSLVQDSTISSDFAQNTATSSTPSPEVQAQDSPQITASLDLSAGSSASLGGSSTALTPFQSEFYRTDLVTGTASLTIPIVVPPGRRGIQPNLALSYSSNAGNSWCGVGWNLDLGSIQRDTRAGIPKYDNTDTFIAGISGANMKLVNIGGSEYRAKIELQFMRFIYQEVGDYWEVWDKCGSKYRFGLNSNSKVTNTSGTLKWSLDEILDTNGNYMVISYTQEQGQIYPQQIQYTGNRNTGYSPKHTVDFILENRTDLPSNYRSGYKVVTAQRLKEIALKTNNEWVRRYVLDYEYSPDTNRSILNSITEYGQDGLTPLPSVKTFTYSTRGSHPGGALYPDLVLNGGSLNIDGEKRFNSITLKNGAVLTCSPGHTGMTLLVDEFVNLESGSRIDLDGKGYSGGAGGTGGAAGPCAAGDNGGYGGTKGSAGSGPGAGSGGTDGGRGGYKSIDIPVNPPFYIYYWWGGGGGGGSQGGNVPEGDIVPPGDVGGAAGILSNAATYDQSSVHAGSGGAGASGGGGGGSMYTASSQGSAGGSPGEVGTAGGSGGPGGNYLKITCNNLIINSGCSITARGEGGQSGGSGGNSGSGGSGYVAGGGGGGHGAGGGTGGGIHLKVAEALTNNGIISVDGGSGGPGGNGGNGTNPGTDGLQGPGGSGGRIELYYGAKEGSGTCGYSGGSGTINGNPGQLHEQTILESASMTNLSTSGNRAQASETGDNLWNICYIGQDTGHENYGPVAPFSTSTVYTQASYNNGVWWQIDADGDIHYSGAQDHYICAWTYLYVEEAKTLSLSYYNQVDHNGGFYLSDENNPNPWAVNQNSIPLSQGYNILYITSYNENQGFRLEMEGGIANQVDLMNSSPIAPPQPFQNLSPLMGDFNGDGRVDIGRYYKETGDWQVALSNESGVISYTSWITGFGASTNFEPIISDFNNDGLTDIGAYNKDNGNWAIALSDGSQFNPSGNWLTGFGIGADYLPVVGDFNGDTKIDVGTYNKNSGTWSIALNSSSFTPDGDWLTGFGGSDTYDTVVGDFNGDGLTDGGIHHKSSGDVSIALCNGLGFASSSNWLSGFAANKTILTGDFNNDGLTDIGSFDRGQGLWTTALSTGASFSAEGSWLEGFGQGESFTAHTGDFSGDGITNAAVFNWENETWALIPSTECPSDLLVEFSNGLGGKTSISYEPSSAYDNTGGDALSDLPFSIQTVSSVSIEDGLGNPPNIINYSYSGGLFDFPEKEFIGFAQVSVSDTEGNIAETFYNQDKVDGLYIYKGMPLKEEVKKELSGGSTALYLQKTYSYDYTIPYSGQNYFPYPIQEESSSFEATATPKTSRTSYQYDAYGNVTVVSSAGDIEITGDEREQHTEYAYNSTSWILTHPAHSWLNSATGQKVSEVFYYYDNHTNYNDSPSIGNLTQEEAWLNTNDQRPTTKCSYDDYGNVSTTTDSRGNVVTFTYDSATYTYPEVVTNQLGHTIEKTYDYKTGQILTSTDPNGQTSRNVYDVFGRISQVFGPNDDYYGPGDERNRPGLWYDYVLSTTPAKITTSVREEHNASDPNKIRTTYAFYDGLGRLIQTKSEAEGSTQQIVSNIVTFDNRAKIKEKYLPYYIDVITPEEAENYTIPDYSIAKASFNYDPLGRIIESASLNDSGQPITSTVQYQPWSQTSIDANGHKTKYTSDAYGQLIEVEEVNDAETYTTNYVYDTPGNLTQTIDDHGNLTNIYYDSLGRKIAMDDPDMGHWSYEYDDVGNLTKQTDTKGQIIEFEYDELNRLTKKMGLSPQGTVPISLAEYLYDDTGKSNCIGRLSKVTDQNGSTEFFYDNLGREIKSIKTIDGTPYTVERTYDALGRLTSVTYPNGKTATYVYNSQGGIETVTAADGSITNIDYKASGQIQLIQYSNGTQTQYDYNPYTLRLSQLQTNSSSATLQDLTYSFDNVGNVLNIADNSPQGTNTQAFQYDDLNRLISATGAYGTISYQYDSIGNMTKKGNLTLTYGEGEAGPHAVTSLQGASKEAISIAYDANGNMLSKGDDAQYEYDIENRLTSVASLRESVTTEAISINLTPGWNFIGIPLELSDYSIANVLSSIEGKYEQVTRYNPVTGSFESFINNSRFDQFSEFAFGEAYMIYITEECTLSLQGAEAEEAISKGLTTGWNLIASPTLEDEIPTEEALNNLVQGIDYSKVAEYNGFDYNYNPATLQRGKSYYIYALKDCTWQIPVDKDITTFTYDGDGGRVKKTTSLPGEAEVISTTYTGSLYEQRQTLEGIKEVFHIFNGATRVLSVSSLQGTEGDEAVSFYHSDHLGSSNVITDLSGNQVQLLEYTPYGLTNRQEGDYNTNYTFTGKEYDSSTALCYYGARYYDPEIARFITPDEIIVHPDNPQYLNRYVYCLNNPIIYQDPTGNFPWVAALIGAFIGAVAGGVSAYRGDGNIGLGILLGAVTGFFAGATIGAPTSAFSSSFSAGLFKASAFMGMTSNVTGAMPGKTWGRISRYTGYTAAGLGAAGMTWEMGVGIASWIHEPNAGVILPGGGAGTAQDIDQYGEILVPGINTTKEASINVASQNTIPVFHNPTHGPIADFTESILEKITFTGSVDRQLASVLSQTTKSIHVIAHSQGTIIASNALLQLGITGQKLTAGSRVSNMAAAITQPRAVLSAFMGGADMYYKANLLDPINVTGPNLNPAMFVGGMVGGLTQGATHHALSEYGISAK